MGPGRVLRQLCLERMCTWKILQLFCGRDRERACTPLQDLVQQILKILTQILRFSGSAEIFRG